jgi:hypothetical protein
MSIAILCPTRGRPEQYIRMYRSVNATQETGVKVFGMVSDNDPTDYAGKIDFDKSLRIPDWPTVHKWNHGAQMVFEQRPDVKLFMLGADDMVFSTPLWDKALLDHYNALENKIHVYALRDSRDENGTPHPIVTREYIEAIGWFLPPYFLHWYVDSWTVSMAKANNCFTHLKDYLLIHDKPSDKGQPDETHSRIREWGWHERDKWVNDKLMTTAFGMDCQRLRQALAQ